MKIRAAGLSDLPAIMEIINEARRNLKEQGINQWQRSYPNAGVIERDIVAGNCYVAEEEGQVAASFAVSFDGDADYDKIYTAAGGGKGVLPSFTGWRSAPPGGDADWPRPLCVMPKSCRLPAT